MEQNISLHLGFRNLRMWTLVPAVVLLGVLITASLMMPEPFLILVVPVAVMLGVGALRYPGAVFAAYIYIPFYKAAVDAVVPVDLTVVLAAACIGLTLFQMIQRRALFALPAWALWTALAVVITFGAIYSPVLDRALPEVLYFVGLAFLPLLLGTYVGSSDELLKQFLIATGVVSIIVTIVGILELISGQATTSLAVGANTIGTGRSVLLLILISPYLMHTPISWLGRLGVILSPFSFLVAVASGSRGPLLMALVTTAIVSVIVWEHMGRKLLASFLAMIAVMGLVQLPFVQTLIPSRSLERIVALVSAVFSGGNLDSSSQARVVLLEAALEMFSQRPIAGYGTAAYAEYARSIPLISEHTYPHNILAQMGAEFGVIGIFAFSGIVTYALLVCVRQMHNRWHRAVFALMIFAVSNAMLSNGIDNRWLWGMLVLGMSLMGSRQTDPRVEYGKKHGI